MSEVCRCGSPRSPQCPGPPVFPGGPPRGARGDEFLVGRVRLALRLCQPRGELFVGDERPIAELPGTLLRHPHHRGAGPDALQVRIAPGVRGGV